jgi:hypothetical protein
MNELKSSKQMLDAMVDRFLAWPLPQSVCADLCATDSSYKFPRSGTNLLNVYEATSMLEHVTAPMLAEIERLTGEIERYKAWAALVPEGQSEIERLRAALAVHKTICPACETVRTGDVAADETKATRTCGCVTKCEKDRLKDGEVCVNEATKHLRQRCTCFDDSSHKVRDLCPLHG